MAEDILSPAYWKQRLDTAGEPHHAVFRCPGDDWRKIENKHKIILANYIRSDASVLDVGCGWGRLLDLMPCSWTGKYLGIDISPDFIGKAIQTYPGREFQCFDMIHDYPNVPAEKYDWAVLISIRPMVSRNLGRTTWLKMEENVRRMANSLLYLEYDVKDNGKIE